MNAIHFLSSAVMAMDMPGSSSLPAPCGGCWGPWCCSSSSRSFWAFDQSPTTASGSSKRNGPAKVRCPKDTSSRSAAKPVIRSTCFAAEFTCSIGRGNIASTKSRWSPSRRARLDTSTPATASRCPPARRSAASSNAIISRTPGNSWAMEQTASPASASAAVSATILREGVYAINLALFVVVTEDCVYRLDMARAGRNWPPSSAGKRN